MALDVPACEQHLSSEHRLQALDSARVGLGVASNKATI
jgi:hypothetical protein